MTTRRSPKPAVTSNAPDGWPQGQLIALGLTAAGSLAGFVAEVGTNAGQSDAVVVTDIYAGASMLAVFLLLAAGYWVDRQLSVRPASAPVSAT